MKRVFTWAALLMVVVGLASGVYYARRTDPKPEIQTQTISRGDIIESVGATGTLEAVTTVQVGTQVSGTVQDLYADFNSIVRQGQVVARLDPSLFETQVEQARANLVRAEAEVERHEVGLGDSEVRLNRAQELSKRGLIPTTEFEAAEVAVRAARAQLRSSEAQVVQARASLNQAQVNLEHTVITAPIDGIVIARNVDVGQTVAASLQAPTLFVIAADLTKMQVNASIDEADVGRIRPKQVVRFRVDAYPNEEFRGGVVQVRLNPVIQQNVVTYSVVIDVPNPELKLKPGLTANVTIEVANRQQVLRVPTMALRFRPSTDVFAALGQEPPELPMERPGRGSGENAAATEPAEGAAAPTTARPTAQVPQPAAAPRRAQVADASATQAGTRPGLQMRQPEAGGAGPDAAAAGERAARDGGMGGRPAGRGRRPARRIRSGRRCRQRPWGVRKPDARAARGATPPAAGDDGGRATSGGRGRPRSRGRRQARWSGGRTAARRVGAFAGDDGLRQRHHHRCALRPPATAGQLRARVARVGRQADARARAARHHRRPVHRVAERRARGRHAARDQRRDGPADRPAADRRRHRQSADGADGATAARRHRTPMSATPLISVRDLRKVYHTGDVEVHALRGVSLDIERRRVRLGDRPVRLGQVDVHAHRRLPRSPFSGTVRPRGRTSRTCRATTSQRCATRRSGSCSRGSTC
jgi:HlyD family secretion protein